MGSQTQIATVVAIAAMSVNHEANKDCLLWTLLEVKLMSIVQLPA